MHLVFTRMPTENTSSSGMYASCIKHLLKSHVRCEYILWWSLCTLYLLACQVRVHPLVEFMHLVFTRMPGERYHRRLRSLLLWLCDVFRVLINSLVCRFCTSALGLVLFGFRLNGKYGYLFLKVETYKMFKRTLFIRTKHNIRIFAVIPFNKLRNDI